MRKFRIKETCKSGNLSHTAGEVYEAISFSRFNVKLRIDNEDYGWWYLMEEVEEVLGSVIQPQATPDLFESYLLGMYDAFGGDSGDDDLTRQILGKVLEKYKGLNK
tara:strand:+ start:18121 stop:18438 length:318 start_codon:yes stop_codon:yes gene_type:complete